MSDGALRQAIDGRLLRLSSNDMAALAEIIGTMAKNKRRRAALELEDGEVVILEWTEALG